MAHLLNARPRKNEKDPSTSGGASVPFFFFFFFFCKGFYSYHQLHLLPRYLALFWEGGVERGQGVHPMTQSEVSLEGGSSLYNPLLWGSSALYKPTLLPTLSGTGN